jgi:alpha-tubulin suppressor-like RCC1 family protein
LVIKPDGTVWSWGSNSYGQLGNGTTTASNVQVQVSGLTDIVSVAAGTYHSMALKSDGTVWAWGYNNKSQLGDGATANRTVPAQVSGLSGVASIGAGEANSYAVKSDGTVWAWGNNAKSQLGDGTVVTKKTPVQVPGLTNIVKASAGDTHALFLRSDGAVFAVGENAYGQLGIGSTSSKTLVVQIASFTAQDIAVNAVGQHGLALKADGTVWAWGYNTKSQLGDGTAANKTSPVQVSGLSGVTSIAAGENSGCALKSDGTVWAWGYNLRGQLGDGTTTTRTIPVQAADLSGVTSIATGTSHVLAFKNDGSVWGWGLNSAYQLAALTGNQSVPAEVFAGDPSLAPASVAFAESSYSGSISASQTTSVAVSASAYNSDGDAVPGAAIVYGLAQAYSGVSVNAATGAVTVTSAAAAGTVTITASCGQLSASVSLALAYEQVLDGISFDDENYSVAIPETGTSTLTVHADVYDTWGNAVPGLAVEYGFAQAYSGVSIDGDTGEVSVSAGAAAGTVTITAGYGQLSAEAELALAAQSGGGDPGDGDPGPEQPGGIGFIQVVEIPETGETAIYVRAEVYDDAYEPIESAEITYSLPVDYDGVDIDSGTGLVIVSSTAQEGRVSILAESDGMAAVIRLLLTTAQEGPPPEGPGETGDPEEYQLAFTEEQYDLQILVNSEAAITVAAIVTDSTGSEVTGIGVAYSLSGEYDEVSIDAATGEITAGSGAATGEIVVNAAGGDMAAQAVLSLTKAAHIEFAQQGYSLYIPLSEPGTVAVEAEAYDDSNAPVDGAEMTYSLAEAYAGVTIDEESGEITVTSEAQPGEVEIEAAYGGMTASCALLLENDGSQMAQLSLELVPNDVYRITLSAKNVTSFANRVFKLTYDEDQLQLLDMAAQTYAPDTQAGAVPQTGLEILSSGGGTLTFKLNKSVPQGKTWRGAITMLKFKAKAEGGAQISVQ